MKQLVINVQYFILDKAATELIILKFKKPII